MMTMCLNSPHTEILRSKPQPADYDDDDDDDEKGI